MKQYAAQINVSRDALEIAKSEGRPTIYASWDYYSRSRSVTTGGKGWNDYNVVGVAFSWPVFDGWATKAKVEQAIVDLKKAQLDKERITRDIALELKNAYLSLSDALSKIKAVQTEVALYQDYLSVVKQKSQEGIASSLDLDDAQVRHAIALYNQKQAAFDYLSAKAEFDQVTGGGV